MNRLLGSLLMSTAGVALLASGMPVGVAAARPVTATSTAATSTAATSTTATSTMFTSTTATAGADAATAWSPSSVPIVIGHRGASGYRPEHTLASYELAARMGADFIEPDLVSTKDRVLVARHENEISGTTDVANHPEFASRRATKTVDGIAETGWFTEDFTLAELKTLRAVERLPDVRQENTLYNGRFQVPTFGEVLRLRERLSRELGRTIGIYPETKHPTYFRSIRLSLETPLVRAIRQAHLDARTAPIFIQSFELTNLQDLRRTHGVKARLVFLTSATGAPYDLASTGDPRTYASLTTPAGLRSVARLLDGIGPDKAQIIPRRPDNTLGAVTTLVRDAHRAGLTVHPYTFRAENTFLPADYQVGTNPFDFGRAIDEQTRFLATGIDGLFTDQADIGVIARDEFVAHRSAA